MTSIRSLATRFVFVAGTVGTILTATAAPAAAYTPYATGTPGAASTPFIYGTWTGFGSGTVTFPWRTVTRSAPYAAYDQYVCVRMNLEVAGGARYWIDSATRTNCAWIRAGQASVAVNGVDFVNAVGLGAMIYSGNVVVTWQLSNGRLIGTRTYDYNQLNDYRCTTAYCGIGMTTWGGADIYFTN